MIRIVECRLIIEKADTHEKYHPRVISFSTQESYPLSNSPQATINVISNTNRYNPESISNIEFDDIVRLQVSIKYSILDKDVWVNVFEGRIQNLSKNYTRNDEIELTCVGHISEIYYKMTSGDITWASSDATTVISDLASSKLNRLKYSSTYATSGLTLPANYNVKAQQYISDVFEDIEKISGYKRMLNVLPVYYANGNFQQAWIVWKTLPSQVATSYRIIEGTPRLIEATFDVIGDEVANYRYVNGETYTTTAGTESQYAGSASNADSIAKYDSRFKSDTFTWIKSDALCTAVASGLLDDSKLPYVSGQVKLEGTPDARVGDKVLVKIPSLEVNNAYISGEYTVYRVAHEFGENGYTTTLDLGKIKKTEYDYIQKNITQVVKTCKKNFKK